MKILLRMTNYSKKLDVRALKCPLPLLKVKQSMQQLKAGEILYVLVNDRQSVQDLQYFAITNAQLLLSSYQAGEEKHFYFIKH